MKKAVLFCLCIFTLHAQEALNPGGTRDQELLLPKVKQTKPKQPKELTPLQKKLDNEPPPGRKLYWEYHHSASLSYRRDRQKFIDPLRKQNIRNRNTMQLLLGSHFEIHKLVFQLRGQYGWMLNGNYKYTAEGTQFTGPMFSKSFDLGGGYTADFMGTAGVRIPFYSKPNFAFSLIPSAGYKYSHVKNFAEGEKRYEPIDNTMPNGTTGFSIGSIPKPNQQDWFGPFVEGRIELRFWGKVNWDLYYQYHWTALRSKTTDSIDLYFFNPVANPISTTLEATSTTYKARITHGQLGGTHLRYIANSGLNFGFFFEGMRVSSHSSGVKTRTEQQSVLPVESPTITRFDQTGSIQWVNYQVSVSLGHQY